MPCLAIVNAENEPHGPPPTTTASYSSFNQFTQHRGEEFVFSSLRLLCKQFTVRRQSSLIKELMLDMIVDGEMLLETLDDYRRHLSNSDTHFFIKKRIIVCMKSTGEWT